MALRTDGSPSDAPWEKREPFSEFDPLTKLQVGAMGREQQAPRDPALLTETDRAHAQNRRDGYRKYAGLRALVALPPGERREKLESLGSETEG